MNSTDIMAWQASMHLYSCWLYHHNYETVFDDVMYDDHCKKLLDWWDDLPDSFKHRVPKGDLVNGTTMGIVYVDADRDGALAWFRRVKGRDPECYDDI